MDAKRELVWALDALTHIYHLQGKDDEVYKNVTKMNGILNEAGIPADSVYTNEFMIDKAVKRGDMEEAERYMKAAMEIIEARRDTYMLATVQSMFAHALRGYGDLDKAISYYRRTIRLWQDRGHRAAVAHQLVKLFSVAEALREVSNSVRTPDEQKEFEDAKSSLQSGMNEDEFNKVWESGRSMTMEQAIEFAIVETDE